MLPAEGEPGNILLLFSALKCPFYDLLSATFFTFLCSLLVILLFKVVPKRGAEKLSSVPKYTRLQCALGRRYVW